MVSQKVSHWDQDMFISNMSLYSRSILNPFFFNALPHPWLTEMCEWLFDCFSSLCAMADSAKVVTTSPQMSRIFRFHPTSLKVFLLFQSDVLILYNTSQLFHQQTSWGHAHYLCCTAPLFPQDSSLRGSLVAFPSLHSSFLNTAPHYILLSFSSCAVSCWRLNK